MNRHSNTVKDYFDDITDFEELLYNAEQQANSGWEMDFVADIKERFETWKHRTFLSEAQLAVINRIVGG